MCHTFALRCHAPAANLFQKDEGNAPAIQPRDGQQVDQEEVEAQDMGRNILDANFLRLSLERGWAALRVHAFRGTAKAVEPTVVHLVGQAA